MKHIKCSKYNVLKRLHLNNCLFYLRRIYYKVSPVFLLTPAIICFIYAKPIYAEQSNTNLLELSLLELQNIEFSNTFSLTKTDSRNIPAAHTIINREMIESSGARSLDELLEIYVPSMHSLHHPTVEIRTFSNRGIVGNDSVLMLVNGRVMNERRFLGAHSERDISMLGDIESIEVSRGPGAAIHGAGALSAVININTFSGQSFEGADISVRQGIFEEFTNAELRFGKQFSDDNHLFLYYGIDSYEGGDDRYSPYIFGSSHQNFNAGDVLRDTVVNVNQSVRDKPRHKVHLQWNKGDFEGWARYVSGGARTATGPDFDDVLSTGGSGYDQLTLMMNYNKDLSENLKISTKLSYDFYNMQLIRDSPAWIKIFRDNGHTGPNLEALGILEQQLLTGISINWTPTDNHQLYLGYEFSHDWHADDGFGWPHQDTVQDRSGQPPPWETNMHSYITEYQGQISERLTFTAGARFDDHSLIDKVMISPRAALVFRQAEDRTFKLIFNHSVRRAEENDLRFNDTRDFETIDYFDFIYHQQINDNLSSELSAFYAIHDLIDYSISDKNTIPIGVKEFTGFDWELKYLSDKSRTLFSVSYVKLLNLTLTDLSKSTAISAEPQGFGDDFAEIPNWTFKLQNQYELSPRWNLNGSVVASFGYDGRRDMFQGLEQRVIDSKIDNGVVRLNLGVGYQFNDQFKFNVNAHNILGWLDRDINNRFIRGTVDYRPDVASLSMRIRYRF